MTATLNNFVLETQLTASEATLVSTTSSEKKFIGMATLTNTSTSNVEITLWRILTATTGTTGSGGNWLIKRTIPANKTVRLDELIGHVLGNSSKISALAATASVINVDISGTTET
jgi:excinuclease UvrABC ATPase subunit